MAQPSPLPPGGPDEYEFWNHRKDWGMTLSAEQEARNLLERMGIDDAQSFSAGDLIELANLIAEVHRLKHHAPDREFIDDLGRRWEWCGGEPGTWAWRVVSIATTSTEEPLVPTWFMRLAAGLAAPRNSGGKP